MRLKLIITVLFALILLLLPGCTKAQTNKVNADDSSLYASYATESKVKSENGVNIMIPGTVEIYQINRETFYNSLENNVYSDLKSKDSKCYKYSENGGNYQTSAITLFKITKEFIEFFSNKELLQRFLAQKQINSNIEDVLVFDAPHTPLSAWIKTSTENIFLTINESYDDVGYVYRIYSNSEYYNKYRRRNAKLTVNGSDITNGKTIYMYHDYSDLPFTTICTALGAEVKWKNETQAMIKFKGKSYELNTVTNSLCKKNNNFNLLNSVSGSSPFYKYLSDGEFYVDSNTLECVLYEIGEKVNIHCVLETNTVEIVSQ